MIQFYVIYKRHSLDSNRFKVKWKRYNVQIITKEELEKPHKYQTNYTLRQKYLLKWKKFIVIKWSLHQEYIAIMIIYATNSKINPAKTEKLKGETNWTTIIEYFYTSLSIMDWTTRHNINKKKGDLNTIHQLDLTNSTPATAGYTFFS